MKITGKKILFLFLISAFCILTGCRMAEVDPEAVCLALQFSEPSSYPFLRKVDLNDHGYWEIDREKAAMKVFLFNPDSKVWEPVQGYDISYKLEGNWFYRFKKFEERSGNNIESDEKWIILPRKIGVPCQLKFVAQICVGTGETRSCIVKVDTNSKFYRKMNDDYFLFFDYGIYLWGYTVSLPPWREWSMAEQ